jgi:alkylhydroperoxidase family enzyme
MELQRSSTMRPRTSLLLAALFSIGTTVLFAQELGSAQAPQSDTEKLALLDRVIANQKKNDDAQSIYERLERLESHKGPASTPPEIKISRAVPAGTGVDHIPVGPDGKPVDPAAYRAELEKLERALLWAAEEGHAQHDAYEKIAKKQKDRAELIDATRTAFLFTFVAREPRADRMLTKYRMEPNPAYKATSRSTSLFAKVRGYVWIDEAAAQLARVEVEVTDDISFGGFLAKVYKGSHLMQERYEMVPGLWLPSYAQYDFDGRRFFVSFAIHERTFYSQYRRIGPPKEALAAIRAELGKSGPANADP